MPLAQPLSKKLSPGAKSRAVAGHVSSRSRLADCPTLLAFVTSTHPGTEVSGDAGQANHFPLQRSFELSPQFQPAACDPRFHRSDTYLQHRRDLFISKSLDIAQHHGFPKGPL